MVQHILIWRYMHAARDKMMQILRMKRKQKLKMASSHSCFLLIYKLSSLVTWSLATSGRWMNEHYDCSVPASHLVLFLLGHRKHPKFWWWQKHWVETDSQTDMNSLSRYTSNKWYGFWWKAKRIYRFTL